MSSQQPAAEIPHILHQTWKIRRLPQQWQSLQQTWKENHAAWEYRFTTDEENRAFVAETYSWFLPIYDGYPLDINRADAFRYLAMAHFGGVYVDLDMRSLRPLDELLIGKELVVGLEPDTHADTLPVRSRGHSRVVCNAFLASVPGHPFWDHVLRLLVEHHTETSPADAAGTMFFTSAWNQYADSARRTILPSQFFFPIDFKQARELEPEKIYANVPAEAYAIHYWHGSWWRDALLESIRKRVQSAHRMRDA